MPLGLIIDCYESRFQNRPVICLVGRLESGATFGVIDHAPLARLYVRACDAARTNLKLTPTTFKTMDGEPVFETIANSTRALRNLADDLAQKGLRTYEGDVDPCRVFLRSRGLRSGISIEGVSRSSPFLSEVFEAPRLAAAEVEAPVVTLSFDIETDPSLQRVLAISLVQWGGSGPEIEEVHVIGTGENAEAALLKLFLKRIQELDPDVLTGWNVIDFDCAVLIRRMAHFGIEPRFGRSRDASWIRENKGYFSSSRVEARGRQVLDALRLVRALPTRFDDLRLGTVGKALLGRGKTISGEEWQSMPDLIDAKYREDPAAFAEYCLEDSRLVRDILRKEHLIEISVSRSKLVGLPMERAWGSVAPFENLYALELSRRGIVAPTRGVDMGNGELASGGLVMEPKAGLYSNILVFDFKSLYPSIMRTFNIDPLAHARANARPDEAAIVSPNDARFARERGILPSILDEFTASREAAKRRGSAVESYVYKILLNSFYGVLGTDSCRFASGTLAGAITSFGHLILRWMRTHFEKQGFEVLYGDTDSLFVDAGLDAKITADAALRRADELCAKANAALQKYIAKQFQISSVLELEFDTFYRRLLLPAARGGETSRAKSYAGLAADRAGETLAIKGMEAVRGDWTEAAKTLQRDLLNLMFRDATPGELEGRFHAEIKRLTNGERDDALVYRKSIRKPLAAYGNNAPHVRAAALLPRPVRVVRYVITRAGPQPLGFVSAPLDYPHYIQTQLLPIAAGLAAFGGFRARLPEQSRSLFGD